ncbi:Hypothetical predicted protein [Mytilus galloprovincialis]|uniref:Uncharacterized protein n=1 Tax=Mytilus galloprovincialis TaxID=29158 RepID=A0A8B6FYI6_MYTGA|nr:Hypothetical predicted protein [Mytilus galloprovincialis]
MDKAIGDTEVNTPIDYALTNGNFSAKLSTSENSDEPFTIDNNEPLTTALEFHPGIKYLYFTVNIDSNNNDVPSDTISNSNNSKIKDAYSILMNMRGNKQHASLIPSDNAMRFTKKDKLYNKVCEHLSKHKCFFPNSMGKDDVKKNVLIIVNTLWYMDGNYQKIVDRSYHDNTIATIPKRLLSYKFSSTWEIKDDLENLSLAMNSYASYLDKKKCTPTKTTEMRPTPKTDLINDITKDLPENSPVPSESTVLFSFVPKHAHTKAAKLYTSKVPLQYKVKTRQLRTSHVDEHYCNALFQYAREYAVQYREKTAFICVDDKCKIDFGEPGQYIQTGVRDGGPDHRLTYHFVKLDLIVLFKKLNLDTLIAVRTAPGHSWLNPAERVMSILNLAIQNCALTRAETGSNFEQVLKSANSMSEIRTKATKCPGLKEAWIGSAKAVTEILDNRTSRLTLKEKPFTVEEAVTAEDVEDFESQIQQVVDASIQKGKYQQQHLKSKEGDALEGTVTVRLQITCETPVEYSFYASTLGRQDICAHCGASGAQKDQDL